MTTFTDSAKYDRRAFLAVTSGTLAGLAVPRAVADQPQAASATVTKKGLVVGEPEAAKAGNEFLALGGNAVDAVAAAALVAGVVNVSKCGIGGYGGHMVIGLPDGKVNAIDFNSAAPAAARADMFPLDKKGKVKGDVNKRGWLAAGVPGTLAGLQLALDKYGTLPFARVVQPAIKLARNGFAVPRTFAYGLDPSQSILSRDPASARLVYRNGKPLKKGDAYRNPDLADMLQQLAESGSAEAFYRGEIGQRIAQAFKNNGGIVTAEDMASYQALEVTPLTLQWRDHVIATAPLTAGGLTILQAIAALKALGWEDLPRESPARTQAWLESLRIAWGDRLKLFGDPQHVDVPIERLLSEPYAQASADKIKSAISEKRPVPVMTDGQPAGGTVHLSAVDANGMMVSVTLTHGEGFGAQVAVDGLGLLLGHGMSRFDPAPGRPNSVAPGKRPLNNMSPTILFREGRPLAALGATGGRRIPNAVFQVLVGFIAEERSLEEAASVPRLHTEGDMNIYAESGWPEDDMQHLQQIGYKIEPPMPSFVNAVQSNAAKEPHAGALGVADFIARQGTPPGIRDPRPTVTRAP